MLPCFNSKVSPKMGLNGLYVRSALGYAPTAKQATYSSRSSGSWGVGAGRQGGELPVCCASPVRTSQAAALSSSSWYSMISAIFWSTEKGS